MCHRQKAQNFNLYGLGELLLKIFLMGHAFHRSIQS
jgi:hypothetical protein